MGKGGNPRKEKRRMARRIGLRLLIAAMAVLVVGPRDVRAQSPAFAKAYASAKDAYDAGKYQDAEKRGREALREKLLRSGRS